MPGVFSDTMSDLDKHMKELVGDAGFEQVAQDAEKHFNQILNHSTLFQDYLDKIEPETSSLIATQPMYDAYRKIDRNHVNLIGDINKLRYLLKKEHDKSKKDSLTEKILQYVDRNSQAFELIDTLHIAGIYTLHPQLIDHINQKAEQYIELFPKNEQGKLYKLFEKIQETEIMNDLRSLYREACDYETLKSAVTEELASQQKAFTDPGRIDIIEKRIQRINTETKKIETVMGLYSSFIESVEERGLYSKFELLDQLMAMSLDEYLNQLETMQGIYPIQLETIRDGNDFGNTIKEMKQGIRKVDSTLDTYNQLMDSILASYPDDKSKDN